MGVENNSNCMRDKILVLNELKKHNNNIQLVSEKTGFDKETIRKWAQQKNKVQAAPNKAKKRRGGGGAATSATVRPPAAAAKPAKPVYIMTVEEKLWECYNKYRDAGHYVTISRLRDLTCQIIKENELKDFEYTSEWLKSWLDTYKLVPHKESSSESSSPVGISDSEERAARTKKEEEREEKRKLRVGRENQISSEDYIFREDEIDAVIRDEILSKTRNNNSLKSNSCSLKTNSCSPRPSFVITDTYTLVASLMIVVSLMVIVILMLMMVVLKINDLVTIDFIK